MELAYRNELVPKLISGTYEEFCKNILVFLEIYDTREKTNFEELNNNLREKLWKRLFYHLTDYKYLDHHQHCLAALRILSRDKTNLNVLVTDNVIKIILQNADLTIMCKGDQISYTTVTIEALKLLCNLLFNSEKVQQSKELVSSLPFLINRMKNYTDNVPNDVKLFDTRILFLLTAFNISTRDIVRVELCGDVYLIKMLEEFFAKDGNKETVTKAEEIMIVCEALKVLFNLYIHSDDTEVEDQEKYTNLVSISYKLLTYIYPIHRNELQSNVINLLTVIPYNCYTPIAPSVEGKDCNNVYQNMDMSAISIMLEFLQQRLNYEEDLIENISPVITVLLRLVKTERKIRKYARLRILPPLRNVMSRPEKGSTLRAKLCKLLISPLTELRDLVGEFIFILCKENVGRMVKYIGYGNAAGILAKKGLLGGSQTETAYSSDSENSDTEEYLRYKERINPITGCYERPMPNPFEGISEERKEYEAMQLVNFIDKLTKKGIVRPCGIGADGKPKPIDHVLELQKELPKEHSRKDSVSDSE